MTTTNTSKLLRYAELVLNPCSRVYGSAPCTASVGVTGDFKCYNSPRTCQDPANYLAGADQIVRWAMPTYDLPLEIQCTPCISDISRRPQIIDPGESMGVREAGEVSMHNCKYNDAEFDNYLSDRPHNPYSKGTYWGKFFSRWGGLQGYEFRTVDGYVGQDINDMDRRYYVVDSTSGPDSKGNVSFVFKDAVKLIDGDKAQAPLPSSGTLSAALTFAGTSITLLPAGIGNLEYPASGLASIGEEAVTFTRVGDVCTIVRGLYFSKQEEHDAGDTFQLGISYVGQTYPYIINDLLANYTDLPSEYLDLAVWELESDNYVGNTYDAKIMKPTPVKTLVEELIREVGLFFFTDLKNKKISIKALRAFVPTAAITDDYAIAGTITSKPLASKRVSDVWVYYGKRNPLEKQDQKKNYSAIYARPTENAIVALEASPRAIKEVACRWIKVTNSTAAEYIADSIIYRYETAPRQVSFKLPPTFELLPGQAVTIESRIFEDSQGDPEEPFVCQVIAVTRDEGFFSVLTEELKLNQLPAIPLRIINIDEDVYNINLRTLHDSIYSPAGSGDTVRLVIGSAATIGSLIISDYALNIGSWPAGVTLEIDGTGRVQGKGGNGVSGSAGENGGDALYTREALEIIGDVKVYGGGGAGGGATYYYPPYYYPTYVAGGGGSGSLPGTAGATKDAGGVGGGAFGTTLGDGGGIGEDGDASAGTFGGIAGGVAGNAIDGVSYITITGTPDIVGDQIN